MSNNYKDVINQFNSNPKGFIDEFISIWMLTNEFVNFTNELGLLNEFRERLTKSLKLSFDTFLDTRPKELGGNPFK